MGRFIKGDIVVMPFPFSDLSSNKKRPAIVLADLKGDKLFKKSSTVEYSSMCTDRSVKLS